MTAGTQIRSVSSTSEVGTPRPAMEVTVTEMSVGCRMFTALHELLILFCLIATEILFYFFVSMHIKKSSISEYDLDLMIYISKQKNFFKM